MLVNRLNGKCQINHYMLTCFLKGGMMAEVLLANRCSIDDADNLRKIERRCKARNRSVQKGRIPEDVKEETTCCNLFDRFRMYI